MSVEDLDEDEKEIVTDPDEPENTPEEVINNDDIEDHDGSEGEETEIVHVGEEGSQPKSPQENLGIRSRINKLNEKAAVAEDKASQASSDLAVERERSKLLQLALNQQKQAEAPKMPDPVDYDDGVSDPKYAQASKEYIDSIVSKGIQQHVAQQASQPAPADHAQVTRDLMAKQTDHYDRAAKLKIANYGKTEDQAIAILGNDTVNELIKSVPNSELVLYHLGRNPNKAENIAYLIKTNPVEAILEIGKLSGALKAQKRAKQKSAPDPDVEISGGGGAKKTGTRGPPGAIYD